MCLLEGGYHVERYPRGKETSTECFLKVTMCGTLDISLVQIMSRNSILLVCVLELDKYFFFYLI